VFGQNGFSLKNVFLMLTLARWYEIYLSGGREQGHASPVCEQKHHGTPVSRKVGASPLLPVALSLPKNK
jgi:hypothetical protein